MHEWDKRERAVSFNEMKAVDFCFFFGSSLKFARNSSQKWHILKNVSPTKLTPCERMNVTEQRI